jgi:hypothetical protein
MASERLLELSIVKYSASRSGMSRSWRRVTSPPLVRSTLSTSAPNHASSCVQAGPAWTPVKSITLTPASGREFVMVCSFWSAARLRPVRVPAWPRSWDSDA